MNSERRKKLESLYCKLTDIKDILDEIKDEEECCFDNIPENLQNSEKYERVATAYDALDSAFTSIEETLEYIEEAIQC